VDDDWRTCRTCGEEFSVTRKKSLYKGGYIDQCAGCSAKSKDADLKYLGTHEGSAKGNSPVIHKSNLRFIRHVLKVQNRRGRTANLDLRSAVNISAEDETLAFSTETKKGGESDESAG